jgi:hypothetical protein
MIPVGVVLTLAGLLIVIANENSWSQSALQWSLTAIFVGGAIFNVLADD